MNSGKRIKYVHEGKYVAEADVEVLEDETGWSPYLSVEDAYRLDEGAAPSVAETLRPLPLSRAFSSSNP
jgi:hypothetical protein